MQFAKLVWILEKKDSINNLVWVHYNFFNQIVTFGNSAKCASWSDLLLIWYVNLMGLLHLGTVFFLPQDTYKFLQNSVVQGSDRWLEHRLWLFSVLTVKCLEELSYFWVSTKFIKILGLRHQHQMPSF